MKVAIVVLVLLAAGVFGLIMLTTSGGATQSSLSFSRLLAGEGVDKSGKARRVSLTCQIATMHNKFNPIEFDAIDVGKRENETEEETKARFATNPKIRVVYHGHDKLMLSNYNHVHITGTWDAASKTFTAELLTTQCPSHYEEAAPSKPGQAQVNAK